MEYLLLRVEYDYLGYLLPQKSRSNCVLMFPLTHFVFLLSSIAEEADRTPGPSNRSLKNEKKKVIVYAGTVVVVL
jgi:hypothetical protein